MTTVFRSCLPQFYSNTNQSISIDNLSNKTNYSKTSLNNDEHDPHAIECSSIITNQNSTKSNINQSTHFSNLPAKDQFMNNECNHIDLLPTSKATNMSSMKNTVTKRRGPCYSRINEQHKPLLKRLVNTIFGNHESTKSQKEISSSKKQRSTRNSKKTLLPPQSTLKKQFEANEKTLNSLVTLLTRIESNPQLPANENISIENEQAQNNNNRIDDAYVKNGIFL